MAAAAAAASGAAEATSAAPAEDSEAAAVVATASSGGATAAAAAAAAGTVPPPASSIPRPARLPLARVRALVKADPDVSLASQEAVFILARAAELFVETIAKDAYVYAQQGKRKTLQRKDLDNAIEAIDEFAFLEVVGVAARPREGQNIFAERGCCERQGHYVYIGHDISGSPLSVDVGMCRTHCGGPQRRNSYISGFPSLSRQSSMLDFIRTKKDKLSELPVSAGSKHSSCPLAYHCEPSRVRVENVLLLDGVQQVEVIEGCHCSANPAECLRLPFLKTFFPDSPLEQTVDVGKCSSPPRAEDGLFCLPTNFDSVLLKSPNRNEMIQTLESCDLQEACYRISHQEYYFEVVLSSAGERLEQLKEIDVGRCFGQCSSRSRCLLRDPQTQDKCLLWADTFASSCIPHQYKTHTFRSRSGQLRTVFTIQSCKCEGPKGIATGASNNVFAGEK